MKGDDPLQKTVDDLTIRVDTLSADHDTLVTRVETLSISLSNKDADMSALRHNIMALLIAESK